ncbi:MAG: ABC transporter [Herpetosiphonaceae bacterium]|nr:MAG: ABC transporter [Herpetosiphonaceae bacterium]
MSSSASPSIATGATRSTSEVTGLFRRRLESDIFWALQDVSFAIQRGETVGLIGHNGSGKSTTLKLVSRILQPTSGTVSVNGRVSALLELGSGFHPDLTGRENIYLNGSLLGYSRAEMRRKMDEIVEFAEMEQFIDMPVKHYSSGMYMRLGFSIAVSVDPDILITDEVLAVGDEIFQRKCLDRIYKFKQQGRTILFVSHALGQVQNLCSRVLWFDHGRLMEDGNPVTVIDAYLQQMNQLDRERLEHERRNSDAADDTEAPAGEEAQAEQEDPQRWGTREIEIVRVELLDGAEQPRKIFETGETLIMRMHYRARQRVERPVFGMGIHHRNGLHISGPNTRFAGMQIEAVEGEGVVDYMIDQLPLLDGEYLFSAAAYDWTMSHPYDHHDRKYPVRVHSTTIRERFGTFYIPSRWRWEPHGRVDHSSTVVSDRPAVDS